MSHTVLFGRKYLPPYPVVLIEERHSLLHRFLHAVAYVQKRVGDFMVVILGASLALAGVSHAAPPAEVSIFAAVLGIAAFAIWSAIA